MFVSAVAEARGLTAESIREQAARVYSAQDAVEVGLADEITTFELALAHGSGLPSYNQSQMSEDISMDNELVAAITAERQRIRSILSSSAAVGRTALASHLALHTDMSEEDAVATLGSSPAVADASEDMASKLEAALDENADLRAAAASAQAKAIDNLAGAGIAHGSGADANQMSAEEARLAEVRSNARAAFGNRARFIA
jgi:ClpP class serine protease